jgi:hypothetical protein
MCLSETTQNNYRYALHHFGIFAAERGIMNMETLVKNP